ncbi:MFS transporter [Bifidobacterium mongoliense]|uniref:MFS transporter n=1 Tax=Bifidobacterium mongoliense TaxID=518643 RepID=UPI0030EB25D0
MKRLSILSFLVMFLIGTDTFLISPMLPVLSRTMRFPPAQGGWLVSAYAIGYCMSALVAGPISDRLNRRNVLIAGFALFACATAACGFARGFWVLLALRFVTGLCASIGSPQIWAIIPQLVPGERVAAVMAAPTAGLTVSTLLGVPIGSFLSATSTSMPFFAVGGCALVMVVVLMVMFPAVADAPTIPDASRGSGALVHAAESDGGRARGVTDRVHGLIGALIASYRKLFSNPRSMRYFLAYLLFQTGNFAIMTFIATWFAKDFGLDQVGIGWAVMIIGVGNTLGAVAGPWVMARVSHGRMLLGGFCVYIGLYAILALSVNITMACSLLFVTYMVSGAVFPLFIERLQSLTVAQRGTVSTLTNVTMYAGSTLAGIVGGPLMACVPGFWGVTVFVLAMMCASLALWARSGAHDF